MSEDIDRVLSSDMCRLFKVREEDCYRALLDGYEVEKEKLYIVSLGDRLYLVKNNREVYISRDHPNNSYTFKLTESEIKNSKHSILMDIAKEVDDE